MMKQTQIPLWMEWLFSEITHLLYLIMLSLIWNKFKKEDFGDNTTIS